ncbi:polycystin-1-related protein-like [Physella acuta]|uniref:polycystin-1-related protein-like n=1 Tax=Physella acuta TaxID=109671 RepID=UPI0027DB9373|nr:polycystin-1-related protein-like [Physella acuta]
MVDVEVKPTVVAPIDGAVYSYELIIRKAKKPGHAAYIGCFTMTTGWLDSFVLKLEHLVVNDVVICVVACWEERQRFALLKEGRTCMCSNALRALVEKDSSTCDKPCLAEVKQACGGKASYSVYYTGYIEEPIFKPFEDFDVRKLYAGCFRRLHNDETALCDFYFVTSRLRVTMCTSVCEEHAYLFGVTECRDMFS